MSLKRDLLYPGRFDNATPEQPQGAFKNRTSDTSKDGSYLERDWLNDFSALFSSLLTAAKITPNGLVDSVGASQYFEALQKISTANNKIKTSQFVVTGNTGSDLPANGILRNYSIGDELALGWVALTSVVDATKDSNGNLTASSGTVRYTINKDENDTIDSMYCSVMNYDGNEYTQSYGSDTQGLVIGSDSSTYWLDVDLSLVSGVVFGISIELGRLPVDSKEDIEYDARGGYRLVGSLTGDHAKIYKDNSVEQFITKTNVPSGTVTFDYIVDMASGPAGNIKAFVQNWGTAQGIESDPKIDVSSASNSSFTLWNRANGTGFYFHFKGFLA